MIPSIPPAEFRCPTWLLMLPTGTGLSDPRDAKTWPYAEISQRSALREPVPWASIRSIQSGVTEAASSARRTERACPSGLGANEGVATAVAGGPDAGDHREDPIVRRLGVLQPLEDDGPGALAGDEAVGAIIEGEAAPGAQCAQRGERDEVLGQEVERDATREDDVRLAGAQREGPGMDRHQRARAGRIHRERATREAVSCREPRRTLHAREPRERVVSQGKRLGEVGLARGLERLGELGLAHAGLLQRLARQPQEARARDPSLDVQLTLPQRQLTEDDAHVALVPVAFHVAGGAQGLLAGLQRQEHRTIHAGERRGRHPPAPGIHGRKLHHACEAGHHRRGWQQRGEEARRLEARGRQIPDGVHLPQHVAPEGPGVVRAGSHGPHAHNRELPSGRLRTGARRGRAVAAAPTSAW